MIPPGSLKASVVDIRDARSPLPKRAAVDANILLILGYDLSGLMAAGGRARPEYQDRFYPRWWKRAVGGRVALCSSTGVLAEVAHVVERAELEILWRSDPSRPDLDSDRPGQDFSPRYIKAVRYHYHDQLPSVRDGVETTLESIRKLVEVVPEIDPGLPSLDRTLRQWTGSLADFSDAAFVAACRRAGIIDVISDDADLTTFEGITVHTANRQAIEAARSANSLIA